MNKNEIIKETKSIWDELEINKNTEDVVADLKHLQFGKKVMFYGFFLSIALVASVIYSLVADAVVSSALKSKLSENGMTPFQLFFIKDYDDVAEIARKRYFEIQKKIDTLDEERSKLKTTLRRNNRYSYKDFLNDTKAGKVEIELDVEKIKGFEDLKKYALVSYLLKDENSTIEIKGKNYTIKQIEEKLNKAWRSGKKPNLKIPAEAVLKMVGWGKSEKNIGIAKKALRIASGNNKKAKDILSFATLPVGEKEIRADFKKYVIKSPETNVYQIKGEEKINPYFGSKYFPTISVMYDSSRVKRVLKDVYLAKKEDIKKKLKSKSESVSVKISAINKEIQELRQLRELYNSIEKSRDALNDNPDRYKEFSSKIEEYLDLIKDYERGI